MPRLAASRLAALVACAVATTSARTLANPLITENFESYNLGALDKDLAAGPNAAPNGTGNPWFGPAPPNLQVVNAENGVTPTSGTKMVRGTQPTDFDEDWINLAYRLNADNPLPGNLRLDFRYYDPLGAGGSNVKDFGALGFYNAVVPGVDYPGAGSLNSSTQIQRLCLGASSVQSAGFDSNFYQARVVGATDGYNGSWFNTSAPRTVGWHSMRIDVGPMLPDGTNDLAFYVDNMTTPVLTHNSILSYGGYNVLELNLNYGATSAYMDDVTLSARLTGDVNLDGRINADDYALMDRGFANHLTGYTNGDLNVDGAVNAADYLLLDTAYAASHPPSPDFLSARASEFGNAYVSSLLTSIPEPTSALACLLAGTFLSRRRRPRS